MEKLLEIEIGGWFKAGVIKAGQISVGTAVVTSIGREPIHITHSPRQDGLERREEVEERDGDEDAIVGHDKPSSQGLSVTHS